MAPLEEQIRKRWDAGDLAGAATALLQAHGPEVLGWLVATTRDEAEADDALATASEDLWRSFATFRWECSSRAWLYTLARRALVRRRNTAAERKHRREPLDERASAIVAEIRSRTAPWLVTATKDAFAELRDALPEAERELLVLRVDRDLGWDEIALILGEPSARLRKRFQHTKEKLRAEAAKRGLLRDDR